MKATELIAVLEPMLDSMLSARRAAHSRGVALLASELCGRHGLDPSRGRVAGLAHDLCKELPKRAQRELALQYPGARPGSQLMAEKILHGPAAAVLLSRDYGLADTELLEAIAFHTVGRPGMGLLETLLYCADKLEGGRGRVDRARRDRVLDLPPREMLRETVSEVIEWLEHGGHAVAPETRLLYDSLVIRIASE